MALSSPECPVRVATGEKFWLMFQILMVPSADPVDILQQDTHKGEIGSFGSNVGQPDWFRVMKEHRRHAFRWGGRPWSRCCDGAPLTERTGNFCRHLFVVSNVARNKFRSEGDESSTVMMQWGASWRNENILLLLLSSSSSRAKYVVGDRRRCGPASTSGRGPRSCSCKAAWHSRL